MSLAYPEMGHQRHFGGLGEAAGFSHLAGQGEGREGVDSTGVRADMLRAQLALDRGGIAQGSLWEAVYLGEVSPGQKYDPLAPQATLCQACCLGEGGTERLRAPCGGGWRSVAHPQP